jgi:hypothetical protein
MRRRILWISAVAALVAVIAAALIIVARPYIGYRFVRIPLATFYIERHWLRYAENPFVVYYPASGAIAADPSAWLKPRRETFQRNCEYLKVNCDFGGITFYVFDSFGQGAKYGLQLGFADPDSRRTYETYQFHRGHELTHVIVGQAFPGLSNRSSLLNEGLATLLNGATWNLEGHADAFWYLDEANGVSWSNRDGLVYQLIREKPLAANDLLGTNFWRRNVSYDIAASFIEYLIDGYGLEKLKNLLGQPSSNFETLNTLLGRDSPEEERAFAAVYGKPFEELFAEWKARLEKRFAEPGVADK